jgi:hypothetical protein
MSTCYREALLMHGRYETHSFVSTNIQIVENSQRQFTRFHYYSCLHMRLPLPFLDHAFELKIGLRLLNNCCMDWPEICIWYYYYVI